MDVTGPATAMLVLAALGAILLVIVGLARIAARVVVVVVVLAVAWSVIGGPLGFLAPWNQRPSTFTVAESAEGGWKLTIPGTAGATKYQVLLDGDRVSTFTEPGVVSVSDPPVDREAYLPSPVRTFTLRITTPEGRTTEKATWCAPVVFLSARGTYEDRGETKFGHGMGSRGWRTWMKLAQQLGVSPSTGGVLPTVVGGSPVRYPATVMSTTAVGYHASRDKGKANLASQIDSVQQACPRSRIILFGYSQGADVVGSVWQDDRTDPDGFMGVVSFADPHFNRRWTQQLTVLPKKGTWSKDGLLGKRPKFDDSELDGLQIWCLPGDPVCQARPTVRNWHGWEYDCYEDWAAYKLAKDVAPFLRRSGWEVPEPQRPRCIPATEKSDDYTQTYEEDPWAYTA